MRFEYIVLTVVIFFYYFSVIREDYKNKKRINEVFKNLKVGKTVITKGGIKGRVIFTDEIFCIIKTGFKDEYSVLEIKKECVETVLENL